jgi:ABC-type uncharacterized transport system permease subunit
MCAFGLLACVGLAMTLLQTAPALWFQIGLAMIAVACFAIALGIWKVGGRL